MAVPAYQAQADLLRVLGHPARIRVLELLAEHEQTAGELLGQIPVEAGSLSQQLAVLRRAGLVGRRRDHSGVVYALAVPEVRDVLRAAGTLLETLPGDGDVLPVELRAASGPATPSGGVVGSVARRPLAG